MPRIFSRLLYLLTSIILTHFMYSKKKVHEVVNVKYPVCKKFR